MDSSLKRKDMYTIDPREIIVIDGWNNRTDFSGEEELMGVIKEFGLPQPLFVRKNKNKEIELVDGERRLRAVLRLIKEGIDFKKVPVILAPAKMNEIDLYIKSIQLNNGNPLTPSEEANSFKRFKIYGLSIKQIAKVSGRSVPHIYNRLELANGIPAVKTAVDAKEITISDSKKIINESDGSVNIQEKKLEEIKEEKKLPKEKRKIKKKKEDINHWDFCIAYGCKGYSFKACNFKKENCPLTVKELFGWMETDNLKLMEK